MQQNLSIGVFDSGVGGTSIWKEIVTKLPLENTIYLADSKHAPYGSKTKEEIISLSVKNTEYLIKAGCKIVVVACNTATTNAIQHLRSKYDIHFIGIEPAIKPAALQSKSKCIGILATEGTLNSSLFNNTLEQYTKGVRVKEVIGKGLVPLIESGSLESKELRSLLLSYINPMIDQGIDHLVLGCSHYPYLIPLLKEILPDEIKIIDSGLAVARQTEAILDSNNILNTKGQGKHSLYSNKKIAVLEKFVSRFRESVLPPNTSTIQYLDF